MDNQSEQAKQFVKENKQLIFDRFASKDIYTPNNFPLTYFMAGSPGAGKTEFSKMLIEIWLKNHNKRFVRIDADDIRWLIPGYNGHNTDIFKSASTKGVSILYDYVLKNRLNAVMDSTFSFYEVAHRNIEKSLRRKRLVDIFYIFQDPIIAWQFTKKRETEEGRSIPVDFFVNSFFGAIQNVNRIKQEYRKSIHLHFVEKDYSNRVVEIQIYIENVDNYLKIKYTKDALKMKLLNL